LVVPFDRQNEAIPEGMEREGDNAFRVSAESQQGSAGVDIPQAQDSIVAETYERAVVRRDSHVEDRRVMSNTLDKSTAFTQVPAIDDSFNAARGDQAAVRRTSRGEYDVSCAAEDGLRHGGIRPMHKDFPRRPLIEPYVPLAGAK